MDPTTPPANHVKQVKRGLVDYIYYNKVVVVMVSVIGLATLGVKDLGVEDHGLLGSVFRNLKHEKYMHSTCKILKIDFDVFNAFCRKYRQESDKSACYARPSRWLARGRSAKLAIYEAIVIVGRPVWDPISILQRFWRFLASPMWGPPPNAQKWPSLTANHCTK